MENPRKSALRDSKGNNSVHQDGDFPTRKSATRESKGNNSSHSSDHAGTNGDTPKQQTKKTTRESKGNNLIIRTPDGKINDAAPSPANRRRVAAVDGDGKEKQKGILKNGDNKKSKEGQRRRVTKPQDGNTANVKRPKLKKKSAFEKFGQMFGIGVGNVVINDPYALEAVQALQLRPWHLKKLRAQFDKIDLDGSGAIDLDEFFDSVGEQRSPFTDKLFALIDLDGSGTIEFDEYVRVMATYCMFTKDEIMRFCFECFDVDKSGTIDEKEFVELCKCINNAAPTFPSNFKHALENFDVNEDGLIDYGEFCEIERRYPIILFPAFRLQDVMQKNSLGEKGWLKVIENYERRKKIDYYKATHGGRAPPDDPVTAVLKIFLPCFFANDVYIKVGADMENKHRGR